MTSYIVPEHPEMNVRIMITIGRIRYFGFIFIVLAFKE
jgi:hypothetical protein